MFNLQRFLAKHLTLNSQFLLRSTSFSELPYSSIKNQKLIDVFINHLSKTLIESVHSSKVQSFLNENKINSDNYKVKLKLLDEKLWQSDVQKPELLDLLVNLSQKIPGQITQLGFYKKSLEILLDRVRSSPMGKDDFVKLVFLIGLLKKDRVGRKYLRELCGTHHQLIGEMNTMDFAIFCSSLYKASVKFYNPKFKQKLVQEILNSSLDQDLPLLITFIKTSRQNAIKTDQILAKIRELSKTQDLKVEFRSLVHLFAVLAEAKERDQALIKFFLDSGLGSLEQTERKTRMKDWAKFLYCCSYLGIKIEPDFLEKLENFIQRKIDLKEYNDFDHVIDATLSLRILGAKKLVGKIVTHEDFKLSNKANRVKLEARMKLLMLLEKIETGNFQRNLDNPAPKFLVSRTHERILRLLKENDFGNPKMVQQFPEIRIAGIIVDCQFQRWHLEVLDDSSKLSDSTSMGIFALKMELLEKLGEKVLLIDDSKNDEEIVEHIKKSLQQ
jgi:hypothetical protein